MTSHLKIAVLVLWAATAVTGPAAEPAQGPVEPRPARLDVHGDELPTDALARLGTTRWRHGAQVVFVAFTPDGKSLLSAGQDGAIRLWDLNSGKELRRFGKSTDAGGAGPNGLVFVQPAGVGTVSVSLAPNGKLLAATSNNIIQLWDMDTGKALRQFQTQGNGTNSIAFSPDSKWIASRGFDQVVRLYEVDTGKEVRQLKSKQNGNTIFFGGAAPGMAFSPDGKLLATSDAAIEKQMLAFYLKIWDTAGNKEPRQIKVNQQGVSSPTFSPDGKILAFGDGGFAGGNNIHLYDPSTGKEIRSLQGPNNGVSTITFSPDGKTLAARGSMDPAIRFWDVATGKPGRKLGEEPGGQNRQFFFFGWGASNRDLAYSPDGKTLASGGSHNMVRLWELDTGKERSTVGGHRGAISVVSILPDGKSILSRGLDNTIRRWEAVSGKELGQLRIPDNTTSLAFTPDGKTAAAGQLDSTIHLLDAATGKELHRLTGVNGVASVAFSADGKLLAARNSYQSTIRLYETATGKELRQIDPQPTAPNGAVVINNGGIGGAGLAFSPDGRLLASPGAAQTLRLWDVATGREVRQIALPKQTAVSSFVFSPDGRTLAVENADQTITLWEVASGRERGQFGKPPNAQANAGLNFVMVGGMMVPGGSAAPVTLAFSPDGRTLAGRAADHSVRLWDVVTGQELRQFKGHQGAVLTVAFATDGKSLVSGSSDTTALLWDVGNLSQRDKPQPVELQAKDLEALWSDLRGEDAARAFRSLHRLKASPAQVLPFLQERLQPAIPPDTQKLDQWIADLESEKFVVRKNASEELERLGELAVPALRKVLANQPPLETRKRAEHLVERLTGGNLSPDQLRLVRSLELLELLGSAEVRPILEKLSKGAPGALATREAQLVLGRLAAH